MSDQNVSRRSRLVALLLCWFLGGLGAHRFYVGKTGSAIGMFALLAIGVISSFFLIGFIFLVPLGIWSLVDFIMIITGSFTDVEGKKIMNWSEPTAA